MNKLVFVEEGTDTCNLNPYVAIIDMLKATNSDNYLPPGFSPGGRL